MTPDKELHNKPFDINAWLNSDYNGKPFHERLCFLVVANGGFNVSGWGFISHGGGHQQGLEQDDALELITVSAFMRGLEAAGVNVGGAFKPYYDEYVKRLETEKNNG